MKHGRLVGVRGWQPELGHDGGKSATDLEAGRPRRVQSIRALLGWQLSWA